MPSSIVARCRRCPLFRSAGELATCSLAVFKSSQEVHFFAWLESPYLSLKAAHAVHFCNSGSKVATWQRKSIALFRFADGDLTAQMFQGGESSLAQVLGFGGGLAALHFAANLVKVIVSF